MLYAILKQCSDEDIDPKQSEEIKDKVEESLSKEQLKLKRKMILKNKVSSVGKMSKMLTSLRKNQEVIL